MLDTVIYNSLLVWMHHHFVSARLLDRKQRFSRLIQISCNLIWKTVNFTLFQIFSHARPKLGSLRLMEERVRGNCMARNIGILGYVDGKRTEDLTAFLTEALNCKCDRFFARDRVKDILEIGCECLDFQDLCTLRLRSINKMGCTEFLDQGFVLLGSCRNDPREARKAKKLQSFKSAMKKSVYTRKTDLTRSPDDKKSFILAIGFTTFEGEWKSETLVGIIKGCAYSVECNREGCCIVVCDVVRKFHCQIRSRSD